MLSPIRSNAIVIIVIYRCLIKWDQVGYHLEQAHCGCENVHVFTQVFFLLYYFWCLEVVSTQNRSALPITFATLYGRSKSKIYNFKVEIFVQHQVLWFYVPVAYSISVTVVNSSNELLKEVPSHRLRKSASDIEKRAQLSSFSVLKCDEIDVFTLTWLDFLIGAYTTFKDLNNINMWLHLTEGKHFILKYPCVVMNVIVTGVKYFHCYFHAICAINSQFHFTCTTWAQSL